ESLGAGITAGALASLGHFDQQAALALAVVAAIAVLALVATPGGRAQLLLDLGGLEVNQALLSVGPKTVSHGDALDSAESVLSLALTQDSAHAGVLRELARVRSARFDDFGAVAALKKASEWNRLDAFDMLQIAHLYRDF